MKFLHALQMVDGNLLFSAQPPSGLFLSLMDSKGLHVLLLFRLKGLLKLYKVAVLN